MKTIRNILLTMVGAIIGLYVWSLAKAAAYGDMQVTADEADWAGDDDYDGYVDGHQEYCEDCLAVLGEPGVLTSGKLRAIAGWLEYSDSLLSELLANLDDVPASMEQDQLEYLQFTLGNNAMSSDLAMWGDMLDHNLDPTDPTQIP